MVFIESCKNIKYIKIEDKKVIKKTKCNVKLS